MVFSKLISLLNNFLDVVKHDKEQKYNNKQIKKANMIYGTLVCVV